MKKIFLLLMACAAMTACKQKVTTDDDGGMPTVTPNYPYKIKYPDNWAIDTSHANTMTALNGLKAFETMDTVSMKKAFADSVTFNYDGGTFKGTIGQLIAMTKEMGNTMKNVKLKITDWEAVTGKIKKEDWVTIWYQQKWVDAKGKPDSIEYVNDMKFKAGRIVQLDEYGRHFTPPAK